LILCRDDVLCKCELSADRVHTVCILPEYTPVKSQAFEWITLCGVQASHHTLLNMPLMGL
jgi:hypothetical protein